ncbi:MAG: ATP-binding protein [Nitrospinota bacterium]|nr:ATP-binding protein [Nitrospinota bacterium]
MTQPAVKEKTCTQCGGSQYTFKNSRGFLKASICKCFHCERCDGSGRIFGEDETGHSIVRECQCAGFRSSLPLLSNAGIPGKFLNSIFDNFKTKGLHSSIGLAKTLAENFVKDFGQTDRGLVFTGGPGLGKTHLAIAIIKALILEKGVDCKFVDFFQLLADIRHGYSQNFSDQEIIDPYVKSTVLVIDELAKGRNTEWELTILDQFISNRYNAANKITLFTTNLLTHLHSQEKKEQKIDTGQQTYADMLTQETLQDRIGPRIFSRLTEICDFAGLEGRDIREQHRGRVPRS